MLAHLRANLWLLVLTLAICCVLYPAAVWVVGQVCFHNQAQGSLIDANGQPTSDEKAAVGSRLVAQAFNSAVFFQPRPSAASYNAAASGGSNLGASSPKLRARVAQQLGPIVRYSEAYRKAHSKPNGGERNPQDDIKEWVKGIKPDAQDADIPSTYFDAWLTEQVGAGKLDPLQDFDQVPADMVTTSGSGLDPDITLRNAEYQEVGVVTANRDAIIGEYEKKNSAKATDAQHRQVETDVRKVIDALLQDQSSRPMFGLMADEPLVNVLQLNLSLKAKMVEIRVK